MESKISYKDWEQELMWIKGKVSGRLSISMVLLAFDCFSYDLDGYSVLIIHVCFETIAIPAWSYRTLSRFKMELGDLNSY